MSSHWFPTIATGLIATGLSAQAIAASTEHTTRQAAKQFAEKVTAQPSQTGTAEPYQPAPGASETEYRTGERNPLQISLRGGLRYEFETDVKNTDAEVSIFRANLGVGVSYAVSQQWLLNFDADAEISSYDFKNFAGNVGPSDDPLDEVGELTLRPGVTYIHSPEWAFFGGGIFQFAGEFDADFEDTATYGGFGGARWKVNKDLAVSFGLAVKSRLEDDTIVLPLLSVDWWIDDTWSLATSGLEGTLAAKLDEQWSALFVGGYRMREYRLADDNDVPDGVFRDDRVHLGVGIEFRPNPISSIQLIGGATVWSQLRFDNSTGNKVFEEETDPTAFIGLRGTLRF
ncbi:MAG: hypothetical protein KF768_13005 [Phycisphaeraceae bacterium]|nr:hypothetical protein [Phycisphaeraceae bacterium]